MALIWQQVTLKRMITISNKNEWVLYGKREKQVQMMMPSMLIFCEWYYGNVQMCTKKKCTIESTHFDRYISVIFFYYNVKIKFISWSNVISNTQFCLWHWGYCCFSMAVIGRFSLYYRTKKVMDKYAITTLCS